MKALIMANGEYGEMNWYRKRIKAFDYLVCADGGANHAYEAGRQPSLLIGDMDSINENTLELIEEQGIELILAPKDKDYTDTWLAMEALKKKGFNKVVVWGGIGGRLDHTLTNLYTAAWFVKQGLGICFDSPTLAVSVIDEKFEIGGETGETVSVLALEKASGVTLYGLKYPLRDVVLQPLMPIGVSNVVVNKEAYVTLKSGVLAVFHYKKS